MKRAGIFAVTVLAVGLLSCGGGSSGANSGGSGLSNTTTNPGTGAWSETLMSSSNQQLGSFTFNMMQNGTMLTGSSMNFSNMGSLAQCFATGATMSGQMGPGMMNGGTMNMTMTSTPTTSGTNTLIMHGNMAMGMGSGSGTFTLTAQTPGCTSQTGTFTMTHTSSGMM